ncbi:retrovirus-related pol polyprotein from transposon TNT 1-94 [Tanacetum coccineum]
MFPSQSFTNSSMVWHRRLSHLNFDTINLLSNKDIVIGLLKLKYIKDQPCSLCERGKAKRNTIKTKTVPSSKEQISLLHKDLCGSMWVESINGKKYILVIVDDYSRYQWSHFLRSKDETPEVLKEFLKMIQQNLQAQVIRESWVLSEECIGAHIELPWGLAYQARFGAWCYSYGIRAIGSDL